MAQDASVNSGAGPRADIARDRVARTQIKYHRWAKTDRSARFGDLFNLVSHPGLSSDGLVGGGTQQRGSHCWDRRCDSAPETAARTASVSIRRSSTAMAAMIARGGRPVKPPLESGVQGLRGRASHRRRAGYRRTFSP